MLELAVSIALFAAFAATVIAAVQTARGPQYEAQSRYEVLELVAELVSNEASDPQATLFTNGTLTPVLPCATGVMRSCVSVGNTDYEIDWSVTQRHDLGSSYGIPTAVSINASVVASDGVRYQRSAIAVSNGTSGTQAVVRVHISGDRLTTTNVYRPLTVLDEDSEVVAALWVNPETMGAYAAFDPSACSGGCTFNGGPISVFAGETTDVTISVSDIVLASSGPGSFSITVPQGHTSDATLSGSGAAAFASGLDLWANTCDLPNDCAVWASPNTEPGTYGLRYATTSGDYGTVNVTVIAAPVAIYTSDIEAISGTAATAEFTVIDGSGNPVSATLCIKRVVDSGCTTTATAGVDGQATATITTPVEGIWEVSATGSSASTTFYIAVSSNPGVLAYDSVTFENGVAAVNFVGLAKGTSLEWSGSIPTGVFGPSAPVFADVDGAAAIYFSGAASTADISGVTICISGTPSCAVVTP